MNVLGLCCSKAELDWVILTGTCQLDAAKSTGERSKAIDGTREDQLMWFRTEVKQILLGRDLAAAILSTAAVPPNGLRGVAARGSLGRAEAEGVVQEALADAGVTVVRATTQSLKSAFALKRSQKLDEAAHRHPLLAEAPVSRRKPYELALSHFRPN